MDLDFRKILEQVKNGDISVEEACLALKTKPFDDLGFAKVDTHRHIRQGAGEVIYGAGKTPEQIISIVHSLENSGETRILITRMDEEKARTVSENIVMEYYPEASVGMIGNKKKFDGLGKIVIATGGTSDIPVAEEAAVTAEFYGNEVVRLYDVGVSGVHRLLAHKNEIMTAAVVIAIAGMEGALASVVGGLVECPVIAVPTSIGYGASFNGLSALLSMLNSCASGVSVVNIDNGFGAGYLASMINHMGK